jgi:cation transport ATPase
MRRESTAEGWAQMTVRSLHTDDRAKRIALCCLAIIVALVGGVGLATGLIIRHVVQTAPLWIGLALGIRGSRAVGWFTAPIFAFWMVLMTLIWLYLAGWSTLLSGHFSPFETAMTLAVGAACAIGLWFDARSFAGVPATTAAGLFVIAAAAQSLCLRLSMLPGIARR